ncbi:unnamed protein product, partial [Polarella glacialis]
DKKQGTGTFFWPDGSKCSGTWQHGKQHGVGTHTNAQGVTRRGRWNRGSLESWLDSAGPPSTEKAPRERSKASEESSIVREDTTEEGHASTPARVAAATRVRRTPKTGTMLSRTADDMEIALSKDKAARRQAKEGREAK